MWKSNVPTVVLPEQTRPQPIDPNKLLYGKKENETENVLLLFVPRDKALLLFYMDWFTFIGRSEQDSLQAYLFP